MSRSRFLQIAGLCCAGGMVAFVWRGDYGAAPFALWISALLFGASLAREEASGRRLDARDLAILAVLLALSVFLRWYRIDVAPVGLWKDEVDTARNALGLAAKPFSPFGMTPLRRENWVKTSNLYLYSCWLVLASSGFRALSVKLISVLPGAVAPALLYGLTRRFLSRAGATVAAGLLAASLWQVTLSRWGWDEVLVTALAIPLFAALWDASESKSILRGSWAAGVWGGLSLYTYLSSRLLVAAALGFLVLRLLWLRSRQDWIRLQTFVVALGVTSAPIVVYWIHDPESFMVRVRQLWYLGRGQAGWFTPLAHNAVAHFIMFHVSGDMNPRHNLPGMPMLDPIAGVLSVVGILVAGARWRRTESQMALLWIFAGLLGGILSEPAEAPQAYRTGLVAPACYLLAGLGFDWLRGARLPSWRPFAPLRVEWAVGSLIALSTLFTYEMYFVERTLDTSCWSSTGTGARAEIARGALDHEAAAGEAVFLDRSIAWPSLRLEVDRLRWHHQPSAPVSWVRAYRLKPPDLERAILLIAPEAWAQLPPALKRLPHGKIDDPFGAPVVYCLSAERKDLAGLI